MLEVPSVHKLIIALFALFVSIASAVQDIKVQGSDYVTNVTSDRFQIIGVA